VVVPASITFRTKRKNAEALFWGSFSSSLYVEIV
jgi:hypothetical protein